jgi:transcriptional regulator with XRE-family HTH domain
MSTKERPSDRGRRRGEHVLRAVLDDYREARISRGLTQQAVARAVGISDSQLSRLGRGEGAEVSFVLVAQLLAVVGLQLGARAYPAGGGLRDVAQIRVLELLRRRAARSFVWKTEVPIPIAGDLRAWDAALACEDVTIGVDAESRLRDAQAVDRRVMLKLRDSGFDRAVLLVPGTRTNRGVLREFSLALAANFPVPSVAALDAIAAGRDPGGNAIIVL